MINPYANRDTTNRNISLAERGARITATITTSIGAFIWGADLAARYLPIEWAITPYLNTATGLAAGLIMAYLTDFMFGNLLQRVAYDTLASSHPNVVKWQGPTYFKNLRRAESFMFAILLAGLFAFDIYTTWIIKDPIADSARGKQTTDLAAATDTIQRIQSTAIGPIAAQLKDLDARIRSEERRAATANPGLQKLAQEGNTWAKTKIEKSKTRATATLRGERDQLTAAYNRTLANASGTLATAQSQIQAENDRIAAANQRSREVMGGMYMAFTIIPKILSIILRVLMVITFLAYSTTFNPDLTGDGIIDYADVEAYFQKQKEAYQNRIKQTQRPPAPPTTPTNPQPTPFT